MPVMSSWAAKAPTPAYRKAASADGKGKMAPFHFTRGVPRRSRVLVIVFALVCVLLLLPSPREHVGNALVFLFLSPQSGGRHGRPAAAGDILKFVDPLIGTVNGGMWTTTRETSFYLTCETGHVFPGASLPYGELRTRLLRRLSPEEPLPPP